MLIGGWGRRRVQARLEAGRQDCDPGKQKLKGAIRTETYRRHYCQHSLLQMVPNIQLFNLQFFNLKIAQIRSHSFVNSQKVNLIQIDSRIMFTRAVEV
jgi:hypothetical protein